MDSPFKKITGFRVIRTKAKINSNSVWLWYCIVENLWTLFDRNVHICFVLNSKFLEVFNSNTKFEDFILCWSCDHMKCTDFGMSLVLENVMKIENFQIFCCMQSFHDIHTAFLYCEAERVFAHFRGTVYMLCAVKDRCY